MPLLLHINHQAGLYPRCMLKRKERRNFLYVNTGFWIHCVKLIMPNKKFKIFKWKCSVVILSWTGAQDSKPQPQIYTCTYTGTFPYLPYMYEMRGQLLWHIRILPGLSFVRFYYTPICVVIEAEEISFWASNRNWAVSCYSVHEENYYEIRFGQQCFLPLSNSQIFPHSVNFPENAQRKAWTNHSLWCVPSWMRGTAGANTCITS